MAAAAAASSCPQLSPGGLFRQSRNNAKINIKIKYTQLRFSSKIQFTNQTVFSPVCVCPGGGGSVTAWPGSCGKMAGSVQRASQLLSASEHTRGHAVAAVVSSRLYQLPEQFL